MGWRGAWLPETLDSGLFLPNGLNLISRSHRMTPLRQRFIEDMQLRGLAPTTQRSYLHGPIPFAWTPHDAQQPPTPGLSALPLRQGSLSLCLLVSGIGSDHSPCHPSAQIYPRFRLPQLAADHPTSRRAAQDPLHPSVFPQDPRRLGQAKPIKDRASYRGLVHCAVSSISRPPASSPSSTS